MYGRKPMRYLVKVVKFIEKHPNIMLYLVYRILFTKSNKRSKMFGKYKPIKYISYHDWLLPKEFIERSMPKLICIHRIARLKPPVFWMYTQDEICTRHKGISGKAQVSKHGGNK